MSDPAAPPEPILEAEPPGRVRGSLGRALLLPLQLLFAMILVQGLIGSLVVIGWTYRLVRRSVMKRWWSLSNRPVAERFEDFLGTRPQLRPQLRRPNWILQQDFGANWRAKESGASKLLGLPKALFHSLGINLKLGLQGAANTWVITLPACALWLLGWHAGWINSFTKGYELAAVGPATAWFGILLFLVAMIYLPMAQSRQAVTGEWRSFYQLGLISKLVRSSPLQCLGLALLYSMISLPIMILKTVPGFLPQINPALADADPQQVSQILGSYFFWTAPAVLAAYVLLRWVAGRIYAGAVLRAWQAGEVGRSQLDRSEERLLQDLDLLSGAGVWRRKWPLRAAGLTLGTALRLLIVGITAIVWFSFTAQIFVFQFLTYHPVVGWLNQPLVQLPWFRYLPASIANPWDPILFFVLLVLVGLLLRGAWLWIQRLSPLPKEA